jgi:hypothetical protein
LGRLVPGYDEKVSDTYIESTDKLFFVDLNKIKIIPKEQVVTDVHIVADYRALIPKEG